jgi:F0F1-type ATP synthase assembly protein I
LPQASTTSFHPAGAGAVLLSTIVIAGAIGLLIGWPAGSPWLGAAVGVVVGIPAGTFAVYRRYRDAF